MTTHK